MDKSHLMRLQQSGRFQKDWLVYAACILVSIGWTLFCGKDMNWDQLNYHFYVAYNFLDGRIQKDFMAASIQGYLNPLAYLPFYWMVRLNWHSVVIASVLASIHALNLVAIYRISRATISPGQPAAFTTAILATTLAALSPVYLLEVGTSFIDITTSALVLLGLLLSLRCREDHTSVWTHPALLSGIIFGIATGLKSTNVIFGPSCAAAICFLVPRPKLWKAWLLLLTGAFVGTLITYGYWGMLLWREFRNPFFPYFNSIFLSPDFAPVSFQHQRFLPNNAFDYLTLPFRMAALRGWVYLENFVPDLRFAIAMVLGVVAVTYQILKRGSIEHAYRTKFLPGANALMVFFAISYFLWVFSSGNGRYGIAVSLLCGPVIALLVIWLGQLKQKKYLMLLSVFIATQSIHVAQGLTRWTEQPWDNRWFSVQIPDDLSTTPALYLSIGTQSNSYVFPYLNEESAFSNPIGQTSFDFTERQGKKLAILMENYAGRIKLLTKLPVDDNADQNAATLREIVRLNAEVAHFGLRTSAEQCTTITTAGPNDAPPTASSLAKKLPRQLLICGTNKHSFSSDQVAARLQVEQLFGSVRAWCPDLFGSSSSTVESEGHLWSQYFVDVDVRLSLHHHRFVAFNPKDNRWLILGEQKNWDTGGKKPSCKDAAISLNVH